VEPQAIMWFVAKDGVLCRHNFYHIDADIPALIERAQYYEYERGLVTWVERRWALNAQKPPLSCSCENSPTGAE
jgi:hypothetical protein